MKLCTLECSGVSQNTQFGVGILQDCQSVKHAASLGAGEPLLKTVEELGLPVTQAAPFYLHMKTLDSISKFHGRHISTAKYKSLRYMRRKQRRKQQPRLMLNMTMTLTQ